MTTQEKRTILLALRSAAKILEEELEETPVLQKRKTKRSECKSHIENTVALGIWRKPESLRKTHRS